MMTTRRQCVRCRAGGETRARFVFPFIFNLAKIIFIQLHCTFVSFLLDLSLQKVEPGPGVDNPLATDDLRKGWIMNYEFYPIEGNFPPPCPPPGTHPSHSHGSYSATPSPASWNEPAWCPPRPSIPASLPPDEKIILDPQHFEEITPSEMDVAA